MGPLRVNATIEFNRIGLPRDIKAVHPGIRAIHGDGGVLTGANGSLMVSDSGIVWEPGRLGRMRKTPSFSLRWDEIRSAEIIDVFGKSGPSEAMISIETVAGGLDLIIAAIHKDDIALRLAEILGRD